MASRWMEGKLARMRKPSLRFVPSGSIVEAKHCDGRALTMPPSHRDECDRAISEYQGRVTRVPCKGRMPARAYGKLCHGSTRGGLNLNPISERAAREKTWALTPKGVLCWAKPGEPVLIKRRP